MTSMNSWEMVMSFFGPEWMLKACILYLTGLRQFYVYLNFGTSRSSAYFMDYWTIVASWLLICPPQFIFENSFLQQKKKWDWQYVHMHFLSKASSDMSLCLGTLWSQSNPEANWWCFYVWNWSCNSPQISVGTMRPIAFALCSFSPSQQKYAQIEKKPLFLILGVKNFQKYLDDRWFLLLTDLKPMLALWGLKNGISSLAAAGVQ